MSHPFDVMPLSNGASFIFTPCPGTKNGSLTTSLQTLKSAGASAVISLLPDSEMKALDVADLGDETANQGMTWFQLPIEDDCPPEDAFFNVFATAKPLLLEIINAGGTIAIHCRGGSGRTGLMAAILLLENGGDWRDIVSQIQTVRPKALTLPVHISFLKMHYSI